MVTFFHFIDSRHFVESSNMQHYCSKNDKICFKRSVREISTILSANRKTNYKLKFAEKSTNIEFGNFKDHVIGENEEQQPVPKGRI